MFSCTLHNWFSLENPCPACQKEMSSTTNITINAEGAAVVEYMIFDSHESYINENLSKYFKDGWVVAGDAQVRHVGPPTSARFIYIPLKRFVINATNDISELNIKTFAPR